MTGNEGNVENYVHFTGFMWEQAKFFGALLVFAEVGTLVPIFAKLRLLHCTKATVA